MSINKIVWPVDPAAQGKLVEATIAMEANKQRGGWLGYVFGVNGEKAGNIAGFLAVAGFVAAVYAGLCFVDQGSLTRKDAVSAFLGVAVSSLSFLAGRSSTKPK